MPKQQESSVDGRIEASLHVPKVIITAPRRASSVLCTTDVIECWTCLGGECFEEFVCLLKSSVTVTLVAQVLRSNATQAGRPRPKVGAKLTRAGTSSRQSTLSRIEYPTMGCNAELVRCSLAIKGELSSSRRMSKRGASARRPCTRCPRFLAPRPI